MSTSDAPALLGGPAACQASPPCWPPSDPEILAAMQAAFVDGSWGKYHGGHVERLEAALVQFFQTGFALTCGSGTGAVELALHALKVGPGDGVVMAAYDYPGNFLAIHAVGARPTLVDIAPHHWNLDPDLLDAAIDERTKAILVSHLHGGLVPMAQVMEIARRRGVAVIEDAAQAPGAKIDDRRVGTWGDLGVISFGGSKLLTAGRGGAVLTARPELYQRLRVANIRGNVVNPLSELQAAVLLPQLEKLDERNRRRERSVEILTQLLAGIPGLRPFSNRLTESRPAFYKVGFQYDAEQFGLSGKRFVEAVRAEGVPMDAGFAAVHVGRSPTRFQTAGNLLIADRAHAGAIVLHHPILLADETALAEIAAAIQKIAAHAPRLKNP